MTNALRGGNSDVSPGLRSTFAISDGAWLRLIGANLDSLLRLCLIVGVVASAAATGVTALSSAAGVLKLPYALALLDHRLPGIFRLHMAASGFGLILLPWALLLRRATLAHRLVGRGAACFLIVGIAASLPSALMSEALPFARLGFLVQGVLSLAFLVRALNAIVSGNVERHTRFMLRVSALLLGVILLRLMVLIANEWRATFDISYAIIAWTSWIAPLAMVEVCLWRAGGRGRRVLKTNAGLNRPTRIPMLHCNTSCCGAVLE
jgi:hypothetical protein